MEDMTEGQSIPLKETYEIRFAGRERKRAAAWDVLVSDFFQPRIDPTWSVLEVGAGYCEFINRIQARERIALDLNPDTAKQAAEEVRVILGSSTSMVEVGSSSIDLVFMSNFLEHLEREAILATLRECRRVLKPGGRIMILQPNIRFLSRDFWMFFDHLTPIDDRALVEALGLAGLETTRVKARFLPFTFQSRFPVWKWLIRLYLRVPPAQWFFGRQSLVEGKKPTD